MQCPSCSANVAPGTQFCDDCRVALRFEGGRLVAVFPEIRRGEVLATFDLSRDPLPSYTERSYKWKEGSVMEPAHNGILFTLPTTVAFSFTDAKLRTRDACSRATFTALEPEVYYGIVARQEPLGGANTQYQLEVMPEQRAARLVRYFFTTKTSGVSVLAPWTQHASIAPTGYPNEVELRFQGPTLQGWVNGAQVLAVHDLAWGIGATGPRIGRQSANTPRGARIVCHGFDVRMVAA